MGLFSRNSLEPHQKLALEFDRNPYYPFTQIGDNHLGPKFFFTVRYGRFYASMVLAVLSIITFSIFIAIGFTGQSWFVIPIATFILSLGSMYTYKDVRTYILDGATKTYSFHMGKRLVIVSDYHNVYIRLAKKFDSGGKAYYYLIFNGYRIDRQIISGASMKVKEMRLLGTRLADRLGINYFDEPNVSPYHKVRHFPPTMAHDANRTLQQLHMS